MATTNLSDANILLDFTVWLRDRGMIGESPSFQPPEIRIQTEEYRGGGMDMAVDIPMGVEKIDFDFDVHVWNPMIFQELGYGPNSMNVPLMFRGYLQTPNGEEKSVIINTSCLVKEVKPSKVQPGKKTEINVSCSANYYQHIVDGLIVNEISAFDKVFIINGEDKSKRAREILGFGF